MTTLTQSITRSRRGTLVGIVGFAAALAAASQVAIPIPGTPVPITLQPFVVVLAGMLLGPVAGAASMVLYLCVGATGLPVFAPMGAPGIARFFGPTGGYLIAYPASAYVAGLLSRRAHSFGGRWLAAVVGIALLFVGGITQLTFITGSFSKAVALGISPFAVFDLVKAAVAAAITGSRTAGTNRTA
jgi:biotin transport system substrate-specific component